MSQSGGRKRAAAPAPSGRAVRQRNDDPDYLGELLRHDT